MTKRALVIFSLSSFLILGACRKYGQLIEEVPLSTSSLVVPAGFSWEMSKSVDFRISTTDTRFVSGVHTIAIYNGNPLAGAKVIARGATVPGRPYKTRINLADILKDIYIIKTAPNKASVTQKIAINNTYISVTFGVSDATVISAASPEKLRITSVKGAGDNVSAGPDCSSDCDVTADVSKQIVISGGKTYCASASSKQLDVKFSTGGGTLRLCGTNVTFKKIDFSNGTAAVKLVVTSGSSVIFPDIVLASNRNTFENYGDATIDGDLEFGGTLINDGDLSVEGNYNTYDGSSASATHTNTGTIYVQKDLSVGTTSTFTNNGELTVDRDLLVISNKATLVNNCFIDIRSDLTNDGLVQNNSYIQVGQVTTVDYRMELKDVAMLKTQDIIVNSTIIGLGKTSLVKVDDNSRINKSGIISEAIQYCDKGGIERDEGEFIDGAVTGCDLNIPVSDCNPEGNGDKIEIADADGDGVNDTSDEYPFDADKAYNSPGSVGTLAFEDQWPQKGDYDMNDLVVSYRYNVVTNSSNEVVKVEATYTLYATGGDFENGFGVEFPVKKDQVSNVTGAKLEDGQEKAVIVLFNDMHTELAQWNTYPGRPVSPPKVYTVSFDVARVAMETFGVTRYNPFVWNNSKGYGRQYEIHLPGGTPTSLFDTKLFNTVDDASKAMGKTYVTSGGLPWGIDIPLASFSYPIEGADISNTYLKLAEWAKSGGLSFPDWYSNTAEGYRNTKNIYQGK